MSPGTALLLPGGHAAPGPAPAPGRPSSSPLRVWLPARLSHPSDAPSRPLSRAEPRPQGAGVQRGARPPAWVWTPCITNAARAAPCLRWAGLCPTRAQPSLNVTRRPFQSLSCKRFLRCGIVGKPCNLTVKETGRGARASLSGWFQALGRVPAPKFSVTGGKGDVPQAGKEAGEACFPSGF